MSISIQTREQAESMIPANGRDMPAFFHLERSIVQGRPLILSDGRDCLMVQNEQPDPLWLWTSDTVSDETLEDVLFTLSTLREDGKLSAIVAKKKIAALLSIAFEKDLEKKQGLLVYAMNSLQAFAADGTCVPGAMADPAEAGEMIAMLVEGEGETLSSAKRNSMGAAFSRSPDAFAWKTHAGEIAAIARIARAGEKYACLHTVITKPEYRNRGYAKALLSTICEKLLAEGRTPILYADRDYPPSNAVYQKLGFTVKDRLTVLRLKKI